MALPFGARAGPKSRISDCPCGFICFMHPIDVGDVDDLRIRLEVTAQEADRRLITVFGSGISSAVLPGVPELTAMFREQVPSRGRARFDETLAQEPNAGLKYQNAAAMLTRMVGEHAVMRAIRAAVLRACEDVRPEDLAAVANDREKCQDLERDGTWRVPPGYERFARFFSGLNGRVRGPVITTNFDPLIEIALRRAGIESMAYPVPTDAAPTIEQLNQFVFQPVLHIHGHWTGAATSNAPTRITAPRPRLDQLLQRLLIDSVVLVVGYSGWLDGFMKSLRSRVIYDADSLQAQVLWAAYESDVAVVVGDGPLKELVEAPGFSLYLGVDGHTLFSDDLGDGTEAESEEAAPFGYSRVPRQPRGTSSYQPSAFVEGRQPEWADAEPGRWPLLTATVRLREEVDRALDADGGGGAVAIGPLGEGKSLAVRQVAVVVAEARPEWQVLWREPGAPAITEEWLKEVVSLGRTLICVDEADLIMDDLVATKDVWDREGSGIAFLLASHDRLWWQGAAHLRPSFEDILFHGITREDAQNLAEAWERNGLLPAHASDVGEARERLIDSAGVMTEQGNTLFGAVLDVRYGSGLSNRVEDLLRKLRQVRLTDSLDLGDVFAGICLMQHVLDKDGNRGRGASRAVIAAMVGLDTVFADGKILKTLGREAAVTIAGNRVYCRHPSIAAIVVRALEKEEGAQKVYELVGQAGGSLFVAGATDVEGYRDAYLLSRNLRGPEAVWAAKGAVVGTGNDVLESRVSLLRALRMEDRAKALAYGRELAPHLSEYRDYRRHIRGFLVEYSVCLRGDGQAQTSAGLAALALDDRVGFNLDASRAGYALVSLAKSMADVNRQTQVAETAAAPEICYVLLERVRGAEEATKYLRELKIPRIGEIRELSPGKLCGQLAQMLDKAATAAKGETRLPLPSGLQDLLSFDDLRRLAERREGGTRAYVPGADQ